MPRDDASQKVSVDPHVHENILAADRGLRNQSYSRSSLATKVTKIHKVLERPVICSGMLEDR